MEGGSGDGQIDREMFVIEFSKTMLYSILCICIVNCYFEDCLTVKFNKSPIISGTILCVFTPW